MPHFSLHQPPITTIPQNQIYRYKDKHESKMYEKTRETSLLSRVLKSLPKEEIYREEKSLTSHGYSNKMLKTIEGY